MASMFEGMQLPAAFDVSLILLISSLGLAFTERTSSERSMVYSTF